MLGGNNIQNHLTFPHCQLLPLGKSPPDAEAIHFEPFEPPRLDLSLTQPLYIYQACTAFSRGPFILSNLAKAMTNVPLPAVRLLKCFK